MDGCLSILSRVTHIHDGARRVIHHDRHIRLRVAILIHDNHGLRLGLAHRGGGRSAFGSGGRPPRTGAARLGAAAARNPAAILRALDGRTDQAAAIELLRDAFDMLEEDFEEELFYVDIRRAYWAAAEGSAARRLAEAVILKLEF